MLRLTIKRLFIVTLLALATVTFYSVQNDVLAKTTGGGPSYSDDGSSDGKSHDDGSRDDSSSGHKKKKPKKEWRTDGNANIDHDEHFLGTTDEADLVIKANNEEKIRVTTEGVVTGTDSSILSLDVNGLIRIRGGAPWAGLVLTAVDSDGNAVWQSISVNDADSNPLNELQTLSQSGNSVTLSNGGGMISVVDNDNDSANELQNLSRQVGSDNVVLSNGGGTVSIADNDNDITNELNTSAVLNGSSLEITDAGGTLSVNLGSIAEESDPVYNAWDKSTGISITESQVSDLSHFTTLDETDPTVPASVKDGTDWTEVTSIPADIADGDDGITTETDPVYNGWNKSTGISITESQVSDLSHFTTLDETDPTVPASVKDGTDWTEVTSIPADIADGDDGITTETDPVYNGWNKSTGISITESQVSDLNHFTTAEETDPTIDLPKLKTLVSDDFHNLGGVDQIDDADADPNNELNTGALLDVTNKLQLTDAGGTLEVDLSGLKDDADADPTNEIQVINKIGTDVTLSNGGGTVSVADNDNNSSNELQTMSQAGTDVTLSNGGGTVSVADNDNDSSNENNSAVLLTGTTLKVTDAGGTLSADLISLKDDADADPNNELNTGASLAGTELKITDAGGTLAVDLSSLSSGGGLWNMAAGGIHYSSGKVGIGTTTPSAELEVAGWYGRTAHNNGGLVGSHNNVGSSSASTNPIYIIGSGFKPADATLDNMYGIGYTHTNASFITDPGPNSWGMYVGADGDARVWLAASAGGSSYFNAGNVGIGTTSPSAKLDIVGVLELSNAIPTDPGSDIVRLGDGGRNLRIQTNYGYTQIGPENTSWSFFSTDRPRFYFNKGITVDTGLIGSFNEKLSLQTSGTTRVTVLNTNGNVGIGTSAPGAKLDCRGSATFNENSADVDFRVESNGRTHALFVDAGSDVLRAGTNAGSLTGDGTTVAGAAVDYVADFDRGSATGTAIGIGSIEYLLDGSNFTFINNSFGPTTHLNKDLGSSTLAWDDVYADNFVNISDGREKEFISDLKYGLKEIKAMRNVSYVLKKDPGRKRRLGLIAQDVLRLIPEAVKTHDLKSLDEAHPEVLTKVEVKTLGVSYNTLIPVLIRATQEQNDLIMKQQAELNFLKKQVQLLLSRK